MDPSESTIPLSPESKRKAPPTPSREHRGAFLAKQDQQISSSAADSSETSSDQTTESLPQEDQNQHTDENTEYPSEVLQQEEEEPPEPEIILNEQPYLEQTVRPNYYRYFIATVDGAEDDIVEMRISRIVHAAAANIFVNFPSKDYFPTKDQHDWHPKLGPIIGPVGSYRISVHGVPSYIEKDDMYLVDKSSNWATFDLHVDWNLMDPKAKATYLQTKEKYTREKSSNVWSSGYNKELMEKYKAQMEEYEKEDVSAEDQAASDEINLAGTPLEKNYTVGTVLGRGDFSVVRKVKNQSGTEFAMKAIDKQTATMRGISAEVFRRQIDILKAVQHKNILHVVDSHESETHLFLVSDLYNGEVLRQLAEKPETSYTEKNARDIVSQLLKAVVELHKNNIVHKAIAPSNVLFKDGEVVLIGFDFAQRLSGSEDDLDFFGGEPSFQAPELLSRQTFGKEADLWSCGVFAYLLLSGAHPFNDPNTMKLYAKIRQGTYDFPEESWKNVSAEAKTFVKSLMSVDPKARPSATNALSHPWIGGNSANELPGVRSKFAQY
eukprot:TRINITY_DN2185_c0_g1_i2.p1 TRINITY_DN2185_c0_g1~~TRINITY_DN2185_c0_g1_i2.p1  ORF type:complete len:550 (+),score=154.10 TRINITY_DN2185_c0_g1_i2:658-2307(+)